MLGRFGAVQNPPRSVLALCCCVSVGGVRGRNRELRQWKPAEASRAEEGWLILPGWVRVAKAPFFSPSFGRKRSARRTFRVSSVPGCARSPVAAFCCAFAPGPNGRQVGRCSTTAAVPGSELIVGFSGNGEKIGRSPHLRTACTLERRWARGWSTHLWDTVRALQQHANSLVVLC